MMTAGKTGKMMDVEFLGPVVVLMIGCWLEAEGSIIFQLSLAPAFCDGCKVMNNTAIHVLKPEQQCGISHELRIVMTECLPTIY
jgi:hypothetical protein